METKYNKTAPLPLISYFRRVINGEEVTIKLVRDSLICRLLTKEESVIFGHTIFARANIVPKKVFNRALERMNEQDKVGKWHYVWNVFRNK